MSSFDRSRGTIKLGRGLGRFPRSRLTFKSFVKFCFSNLAPELVSGSLAVSHLGNRSEISRINPRRNSSRSTRLMLRGPKFGRIEGESHKIVSRKIARRYNPRETKTFSYRVFENMCWCWQSIAWISDDYFESFSPLSNVWIDRPLMPSSDVTTRKPSSIIDWLIVQTFA